MYQDLKFSNTSNLYQHQTIARPEMSKSVVQSKANNRLGCRKLNFLFLSISSLLDSTTRQSSLIDGYSALVISSHDGILQHRQLKTAIDAVICDPGGINELCHCEKKYNQSFVLSQASTGLNLYHFHIPKKSIQFKSLPICSNSM